jgi:hypothetical protein
LAAAWAIRDSNPGKGKRFFSGSTNLSFQWAPGLLSPGFRGPGSEFNHSPPSGIELKNEWSYTYVILPYAILAWTGEAFLGAFPKLRKATLDSPCLFVRLSKWNSTPTERIFMKFDEYFLKICRESLRFINIEQE